MTLYEKRTGARDNINKQQLLVLLSLMRHPEEPGRTMIEVSSRTFRHDNARTHARAHTHTHTRAHTHTHTGTDGRRAVMVRVEGRETVLSFAGSLDHPRLL